MKTLSRIRTSRKRKRERGREEVKLKNMLLKIVSEIKNIRILCDSMGEGGDYGLIDLSVFGYSCERKNFVERGLPREYLSVIDEEMADATKNLKYCKIVYYPPLLEELIFKKKGARI